MSIDNLEQHEALAQAMMDPSRWRDGGGRRRRIDTHISSVILAGDKAFKIKKPVNLGFLNFTTLESRHSACQEEIRLNRRLAPAIYEKVVAITGSIDHPGIDGAGQPIDWAVQMRRFDPDALLGASGQPLDASTMRHLGSCIATFHQQAEPSTGEFGTPEDALAAMQGNFDMLRQQGQFDTQAQSLLEWTLTQYRSLEPLMSQRLSQGQVRECHGDLHLGNIAMIDGKATVFDAIEFNPAFRWIDTINDIAFLTMDLKQRGHYDLAHVFLDHYLQTSADYQGLRLLRFYEVYRALVRAKVAAIRSAQTDIDEHEQNQQEKQLREYIALAKHISHEQHTGIIITHGVSGSGKSYATEKLLAQLPAIRVRSDIERKRLLKLESGTTSAPDSGYRPEVTEQTYRRLLNLAKAITASGYRVIVDATFLKRKQRELFHQLADTLSTPFAILSCDAPEHILRERITKRHNHADNVSDADISVMQAQLRTREHLTDQERLFVIEKPATTKHN